MNIICAHFARRPDPTNAGDDDLGNFGIIGDLIIESGIILDSNTTNNHNISSSSSMSAVCPTASMMTNKKMTMARMNAGRMNENDPFRVRGIPTVKAMMMMMMMKVLSTTIIETTPTLYRCRRGG